MAQLFHNNLIISLPFLLWTEVLIRLTCGREVAVCSLVFIFLRDELSAPTLGAVVAA